MTPTTHVHPKPNQDRLIQYGAVVLAGIMLLCVPLLMVLTLTGAPGGLFILAGIVLFLLTPPVLMLTALSPPVTLSDDGLQVSPRIWRERFIPWDDVVAVKTYPLLPNESQEVNRRNFVGRRNYTPADGFMLVIPGLPLPYRIAAFFSGEGGKGIVLLSNRTHTDYDHLKKQIIRRKGAIQPHD
jgi:hypothetical protein